MNEMVEIILLNIAFWSSIKLFTMWVEKSVWNHILKETENA